RVGRAHDPLAREAAHVRSLSHRIGEFRGEHPLVALVRDGAAGHLLGTAAIVGVGTVDEIDARLARLSDDALCGRLVGGTTEHHGAEAEARHLQPAAPEIAIVHARLPQWRSFGSSAAARSDAELYYAFRLRRGGNINWGRDGGVRRELAGGVVQLKPTTEVGATGILPP